MRHWGRLSRGQHPVGRLEAQRVNTAPENLQPARPVEPGLYPGFRVGRPAAWRDNLRRAREPAFGHPRPDLRLSDKRSRLHAYGVGSNGVLQIVDRRKLLYGNPSDVLSPQISYWTLVPDSPGDQGGHTSFPIYKKHQDLLLV